MTFIELKKILLVSSVAVVAAFGLSACGDDKASAPADMKEATDEAGKSSSAMDDAKEAATEKAGEMVDEAKKKADDMMDDAKDKAADAMDEAKKKAAEEAKKAEEELKKKIPQ